MMITIYTDGSSLGNPGPGGWGVLIIMKDKSGVTKNVELSGGEAWTTNNRMELSAVINALKRLIANNHTKTRAEIHMDSMYVHNGIEKYLPVWIAKGWKLASKKKLMNKDLWQELHTCLGECQNIDRRWVKAHATSAYNNKVDRLARKQALEFQANLPTDFIPPSKEEEIEDYGQKSLF